MSSIANIIKCTGLVTFSNELDVPSGSLRQALNVNVDEKGVITPRRGFNDYGAATGGSENASNTVTQIMEYKTSIIRQYQNLLEYEDVSGTFQAINGTYDQLRAGYRTKFQEASSNLYFTTDEGIKKISVKNQASLNVDMITDAGGLKAGYGEGIVVPTIGGFLPTESKVGYRILFGTRDASNNLIFGSPSSRFVVTNFSADIDNFEQSTVTFTTTTTSDEVTNGDHFVFSTSEQKYTVYYDTDGLAEEPKTAETINSIYIKISVSGNVDNDDNLASITANEMASGISNVNITLDASNVVTITSTETGDITNITGAKDSSGTSIVTRVDTATVLEGSTVSGTSATVQVTGIVPSTATTDYFYQVYRTGIISVSTGLTINDIDPGDEMNLVYESGLTPAEISAGEFVFTDTTPESFRAESAPLYTNEITGEGILQANEAPPIALDVELFRNYTFYANTKQKHKLEFTVVSVDNFISGSTRIVIGNDDITRYYTFTGTEEVTDVTINGNPNDGDYLNLYSANDERQYYLWFDAVGDSSGDPKIAGGVGYRINISDAPSNDTIATRIDEAFVDNVDFSLSVTSNVITFTHSNNGYTTGITAGTLTNVVISAPSTDGTGELSGTDAGGDVLLSGLVSVGQAIDETARSLVKIISKDALSPVNAYYLSTGEDLPGNIILEARSLEDKTFYISIEESSDTVIGDEFTPELPYSQEIEEFAGNGGTTDIKLTGHGYTTGDEVFVGYLQPVGSAYVGATSYSIGDIATDSGNTYECIQVTTGIDNGTEDPSGDTTNNSYWEYVAESFSGVYTVTVLDVDNFTITVLTPNSVSSYVPDNSTIFTADVESDNEEVSNRIYFSKLKEPEAVPIVNFIDVGPQDAEIKRILALRDELYILKDDGIYVLSGTSAPDWSVRLIDSTRIIAPDSAVVLNNQIYCLTEQGVVRISGSSAAVISRGIENLIDDVTDQDFDYSANTFGIAYENDRCYIMFMPKDDDDTSSTQAYRYNVFEQTWSRWEYNTTCGKVLSRNNKLYLGNADRNYVVQERKNNDRTDHSDRNFTVAINSSGISGTTIELSTLTDVDISDVLVQTQEVSIYYINYNILKRMDAFDTGITPPIGSTMFDSFGVTSGDNIPSKMETLNDYLVTLDAVNITAKSFTSSNLKVNTELLIDELNTVATITSKKNYKKPTTVYYEAYITSKDLLRNQVTINTERPFVEGDIELYKGFIKRVEWNPQHFGNPSALKQISYVSIMFDQNNFYDAVAKFASDAAQSTTSVPFQGKGVAYFGDLPWNEPNNYWGGTGNDIPFRTPVPVGKQRCRYLSVTFEHENAREYFKVVGMGAVVREISSKAYR